MGTISYLLDTHTFLWAVRGSPNLSNTAVKIIEDMNVQIFVSAVSAYEIMNKYRLGKLPEYEYIAENYLSVLNEISAVELPISTNHAHYAGVFEWEHRDPFDRLLVAQAYLDNLTLITDDPIMFFTNFQVSLLLRYYLTFTRNQL